jgi:hypothetical protein
MASNFPKLPGYVVTHDPTVVCHKKVSHVKLEQIRNGQNVEVPLYAVPKPAHSQNFNSVKTEQSKSFSQATFVNHTNNNIEEQFEPTFVKLDKQVRDHPLHSFKHQRVFASSHRLTVPPTDRPSVRPPCHSSLLFSNLFII